MAISTITTPRTMSIDRRRVRAGASVEGSVVVTIEYDPRSYSRRAGGRVAMPDTPAAAGLTRTAGFLLLDRVSMESIRQAPIDVGILGATGVVGQQFVRLLEGHPWFRTAWLAASERSEGRRYAEAAQWRLSSPIPDAAAGMLVESC